MEEMKVLTRKNIQDEIVNLMRIEIKTKKIRKLPTGFYDSFRKILEEYEVEATAALENKDLTTYLRIREEETRLKIDFKVFFQRRWEKISAYAPYDVDQETLSVLSSPEKASILEFKAVYAKYFNQFIGGEQ
jgi:DNA replication factor GINS